MRDNKILSKAHFSAICQDVSSTDQSWVLSRGIFLLNG